VAHDRVPSHGRGRERRQPPAKRSGAKKPHGRSRTSKRDGPKAGCLRDEKRARLEHAEGTGNRREATWIGLQALRPLVRDLRARSKPAGMDWPIDERAKSTSSRSKATALRCSKTVRPAAPRSGRGHSAKVRKDGRPGKVQAKPTGRTDSKADSRSNRSSQARGC